jgi:prolyl-tRNA synthetase
MKDLYTFDYSIPSALETYHQVREAYARIFDELKLPYLVADADSGDMGGNLSHEFHFPTPNGEDNVISCTSCGYVANEELAETGIQADTDSKGANGTSTTEGSTKPPQEAMPALQPRIWRGISRDRRTLINVWYPAGSSPSEQPDINPHAVKSAVPEFDASVEDPLPFWAESSAATTLGKSLRLVNLVDSRLPRSVREGIESQDPPLAFWPEQLHGQSPALEIESISHDPVTGNSLNLLRIKNGDPCARCATGTLKVEKAIEMGHTFYLGTRYSDPLNATVSVPKHLLRNSDSDPTTAALEGGMNEEQRVPIQMGCYGIGMSRMIAAVADTLADEKGLSWPRVMAPFETVVIPAKGLDSAAAEVYDALSSTSGPSRGPRLDVVLDDRAESFPWKMRDADLVGYPVIVVAGRRWKDERVCEVQCRRLNVREERPFDQIPAFVESLLSKL